jgi:hypothetical protein
VGKRREGKREKGRWDMGSGGVIDGVGKMVRGNGE